MNRILAHSQLLVLAAATAVLSLVAFQDIHAQLSDPHFDSPFTTADFVPWAGTGLTAVDKWAAESAEVVGVDNGVTPVDGNQMVKLLDDGSAYSELKQRVGSIGILTDAQVDTGLALAVYFACFNAPANAPLGANADILLQFLDGSQSPIGLPVSVNSGPLGNDPNTWEHVQLSNVPVPVGARGAEAIIRYDIASLTGTSGFVPAYVDKTHLGFSIGVPEPATVGLLLLCGVWHLAGFRPKRAICG